jgi:hypothetical protein
MCLQIKAGLFNASERKNMWVQVRREIENLNTTKENRSKTKQKQEKREKLNIIMNRKKI